jgi:hypothetical protein
MILRWYWTDSGGALNTMVASKIAYDPKNGVQLVFKGCLRWTLHTGPDQQRDTYQFICTGLGQVSTLHAIVSQIVHTFTAMI